MEVVGMETKMTTGSGVSSENLVGLILALLSSLFIGSSFILKKKGLMRAGASGIRAGTHGLLPCGRILFFGYDLFKILHYLNFETIDVVFSLSDRCWGILLFV